VTAREAQVERKVGTKELARNRIQDAVDRLVDECTRGDFPSQDDLGRPERTHVIRLLS